MSDILQDPELFDLFESPEAQIGIMHGAVEKAEQTYTDKLLELSDLEGCFLTLRAEFGTALSATVSTFSPVHKKILRSSASPKAVKLWEEYRAEHADGDLAGFLGMCFSDTCGPLLQQAALFDMWANMGPVNEKTINDAIQYGTVVATGLSTVAQNYNLLLESSADLCPQAESVTDAFTETARDMFNAIHELTIGCGQRAEGIKAEAEEKAQQELTCSESMAFLSLITPPVWAQADIAHRL